MFDRLGHSGRSPRGPCVGKVSRRAPGSACPPTERPDKLQHRANIRNVGSAAGLSDAILSDHATGSRQSVSSARPGEKHR